jgi:P4 family phage/plasmid primase-like protien
VDIPKNKWYEFQNHKWVFIQSAHTLEELISGDVRKMMMMYCSEKMAASVSNPDGYSNENDHRKYGKLMNAINELASVPFRSNVVRACASKFYDAEFQAKLDTNVYLVGFENGVYDLQELAFRDGLPSDRVSKTVGYDWKEYDENDQVFEKIHKYFSEVQTEKDMREYILTFIASILRGVPDQKVHLWTGGGGNGKSATITLVKNMLGQYYGMCKITLLTRKSGGSSDAVPELADKFGVRLIVIQEPEHNDVVYVGQMKELSGADLIYARPLYGDPFYYVPQFTMVLTCNNLPHIPTTDNGTWRRLRVVPFESEFVDDNPKGPKQFLKDEEMTEDFPNWAQPMMWLAITKYYPIFKIGVNGKKYKILEPTKIVEHTKNYKNDSDAYAEFLDNSLKLTNDDNDTENIDFIYEAFRNWYSASYNEKAPVKKSFIAYLKKNNYKYDKENIFGVIFTLSLV